MVGRVRVTVAKRTLAFAMTLLMGVALAGCRTDDERSIKTGIDGDGSSGVVEPTPSPTPTTPVEPSTPTPPPTPPVVTPPVETPVTPPTNHAPTISGAPVTTAKVAEPYAYEPVANDPDGDALTFSIRSKPAWARFNTRTGRLDGTPPKGSGGRFTGVQITVTDGKTTTQTPAFNIEVVESVVGSATLSWMPPTQNEDGSTLTDLSGYVIRYGKNAAALDQSVRISTPGITSAVVEELDAGTWYFTMSSVNTAGVESRPTEKVSKSIG